MDNGKREIKKVKRPTTDFIIRVFLVSFAAYIVIYFVTYALFSFLAQSGILIPWLGILEGIVTIALTWFAYRLIWEKMFKLDADKFGFRPMRLSWKWLVISFVMPLTLMAIYFNFVSGQLVVSDVGWEVQMNWITGAVFGTGFAVAFVEELLIRGLLLGLLVKRGGRRMALVISSAVFALLHLLTPNLGLYGALMTLLATYLISFVFTFAYWESGTMLCPILLHGIWNAFIIGGIVAIGPNVDSGALATYVLESDSPMITGGPFGVEASFISIGVILVFVILAHFLYAREMSNRRKKFRETHFPDFDKIDYSNK